MSCLKRLFTSKFGIGLGIGMKKVMEKMES